VRALSTSEGLAQHIRLLGQIHILANHRSDMAQLYHIISEEKLDKVPD
jgi:hypothetical protein